MSNQPTPEPTPAVHATDAAVETARWEFGATPRISSYLVALVAGPYAVERGEVTSADGRVIPLGVFCRSSLSAHLDADAIMETTRQGFAFYEETFGVPYPFDKYDQLFVPEYNMGAMENPGCVTFTESYVFRSKVTDAVRERRVVTILHELAHMWFGDLVTMKWWNDLWLNESFAEYASTLATAEATEWEAAWTTFNAMEKTWAYRQDQLPSTHPIVAAINDLEDVQVNFDGITYAKGASVLKQLVAWVGRDEFISGVSAYFRKHAWGNTELTDLLVELEATSGRDLTAWSKIWLETAGVNTLRPEIGTDADGVVTSFAITQTAPADHPTIRPHRLGIGFYDLDASGAVVRTRSVHVDVDGERTEIPELVGVDRPGLVLVNDDDLAYAKVRLDDASLAFAVEHLSRIADPLARSLVWGSVWDAVRDGETPASAYVDLVLGNIAAETESTTVRTTLAQLGLAARSYVAPARRAAVAERVGDTLWRLAQAADAGSDLQLQLVKYFAALSSTSAHVAPLRGLLDGSVTLDGLTVDTDLRWELLEGLVLLGDADETEIDAALAADDTATGRQAAARARAAVPTVEAKERAFASVVDDADAAQRDHPRHRRRVRARRRPDRARTVRAALRRRAAARLGDPQLPHRRGAHRGSLPGTAGLGGAARRRPRLARRPPRRRRGPAPHGRRGPRGHRAGPGRPGGRRRLTSRRRPRRHSAGPRESRGPALRRGEVSDPARPRRTGKRRRALSNRSSTSTGLPAESPSGTFQFGYSRSVPGWFWERRSPTASTSCTPTRAARERRR